MLTKLTALLSLVSLLASAADAPAFPLKKSANGRCLVDQKNVPFLIAGDAPQALTVNLSEADAELYYANRAKHGFNALWVNLLCRPGTGGRKDGTTFDGIAPFTTPDDFAAPNEAYFARCDKLLQLSAKYNLLIILDACETIDHLKPMLANGPEKCRAFGQYLGKRYKNYDNILWMSGNDFQNWKDAKNDAAATALAKGIQDEDTRHLHTVELDYLVSGSLDDPNWAPIIQVNATYTYYPPYAQVLKDYNRPNFVPVVMIESSYEFEQRATPATLRRIEYWSLLSGACGQVYGNGYIWPFKPDWKKNIDTPGAIQMEYVKKLFEPRAWQTLVPDQKHAIVTAGYGTFDDSHTEGNRYVMTSDYVTAAASADGKLAMAFLPSIRPITVDMSKFSGPATAQWYDPSRGEFKPAEKGPLPNKDKHVFTPPGNNGDGDEDWVLILEVN
ncbi:MAG TPA: DUF4038 domain-containing protein [Planctomycetota bacterium]|nr:DUF4038 domain-containing protein [Planctomycetota bacterium]